MIAVVGAGLTGLALSHELEKRGLAHVVLEAAPRPGGVIRSARVEGRLLEFGPQRTRLTAALGELVEELGLGDELITAPPGLPLFVYARGRLRRVPLSARELLLTDLFPLAAKGRILLEPFTRGLQPGDTAADYLTRKFGRAAYRDMLGPLYGGLYASDPADMEARHALARTLAEFGVRGSLLMTLLRRGGLSPPAACSFRDGLQTLTDALHRRQRSRVRLDSPVRAIVPEGIGYRLELDDGVVAAHDVVLTAPARAAAGMLEAIAAEAAERLRRLRYNRLGVVHLHSEAPLTGLGYQVSLDEELATRGATFNASMFDRDGVYTAYLGGARRPEVVDMDDDALGELAAAEFALATGHDARVLSVARVAMPAWDRSWGALDGLVPPPRIHLCANYESRPGVPGRLSEAGRLAEALARRAGPGARRNRGGR